jgi:hypothetical protein
LEWELSTGLVKLSVGLVRENEESTRFVRDDFCGGGRLILPVGLLNVLVKEW